MSEPQQLGTIFAAALIGRKVRFPDLAKQFDTTLVHTVDHVQFGGYDTDSEEEIGVTVRLLTTHAEVELGCKQSIVDFGLCDRIEFVNEMALENAPDDSSASALSQNVEMSLIQERERTRCVRICLNEYKRWRGAEDESGIAIGAIGAASNILCAIKGIPTVADAPIHDNESPSAASGEHDEAKEGSIPA